MKFETYIPAVLRGEPAVSLAPLVRLERDAVDAGVFVDPRQGQDRRNWALALVVAMTVHSGVMLAGSLPSSLTRIGGGGVAADAIAVEVSVVSAAALESREMSPNTDGGRRGVVESKEGDDASKELEAANASPPVAATATAAQPPKPELTVIDPEATNTASPARPPDVEKPPSPDQMVATPTEAAATAEPQTSADTLKGGQIALSTANDALAASSRAEASIGELQAYSARVAQALAKTRPRAGAGRTGTVYVAFEIAPDGLPTGIWIKKSSGISKIDALAINAISSTKFAPPPAAATRLQRTYELPYFFR